MKKVISAVVIFGIIALWNGAVRYVDRQLAKRQYENVYNDCHKVWSSRGLYNTHSEQNSIESMQRAFDHGAYGAEVDFHYDVKMDRFIISHGHPKKDAQGNFIYPKKNGSLLTLEELFEAVGEGHYFWLDYKNLEHLDAEETKAAIRRLLQITETGSLRDRLYIEASNPLSLPAYTEAGFKTILGIHPLPGHNIFASIVVNAYKMAYCFNNISALAMPYGEADNPVYGQDAQESLGTVPVFLFHVPDNKSLLPALAGRSAVRVMLVGRDKSIDRFDATDCREQKPPNGV
jgi:hypothetical protein